MTPSPINYLQPRIAEDVDRIRMPVVEATSESLQGFGRLVEPGYSADDVEIVRWPAQGWRPVDSDTGDEAGTTSGTFTSFWEGHILFGTNDAVGGEYILAFNEWPLPEQSEFAPPVEPQRILVWHANYHPDGGQLFFPRSKQAYLVPLALPGDDVQPKDFVCFRFDGTQGLYIHPNIWHEGVFTCHGRQSFHDIQGAVHARVSVHFPDEFGCLLEAPLHEPR